MASSKKQRKAANAADKQKRLARGQFRQRDGDRRWRGVGMMAKDGIALKHLLQGRNVSDPTSEEE